MSLSASDELVDPVTVASAIAARTPLYFEPAGCLTRSVLDTTVTFDFQDCRSGAFGLAELRGTLEVTYSIATLGTLDIVASTASEFEIGLVRATLNGQGLQTFSADGRTIVWNGSFGQPPSLSSRHSVTSSSLPPSGKGSLGAPLMDHSLHSKHTSNCPVGPWSSNATNEWCGLKVQKERPLGVGIRVSS